MVHFVKDATTVIRWIEVIICEKRLNVCLYILSIICLIIEGITYSYVTISIRD